VLDSERNRVFNEWLGSHKGILFKVIHAYAFEHADRQDLFQEVAVQVWRSVDAFRGESSVPTWLYRVALNTAIAWTRREGRHRQGKQPVDVIDGVLTTESVERHDPRLEWLYGQIAQLKDVDRSLDELIAIWRSQDAAPLHRVDETLLRLALRQEQVKVQAQRRIQAWVTYVISAGFVVAMAFFCMIIIYRRDVMTGWNLAIPIVGAAAALVTGIALYVSRRAQSLRERRYGDSLRDQLGRRIAQLEYEATTGSRVALVLLIAIFVSVTAFLLATMQMNSEPNTPFEGWPMFVGLILTSAFSSVAGVWAQCRSVTRDLLPRKHRLEGLLKELDVP
jgi:RNA polymerase sigma-70 factor, ECF subfamily